MDSLEPKMHDAVNGLDISQDTNKLMTHVRYLNQVQKSQVALRSSGSMRDLVMLDFTLARTRDAFFDITEMEEKILVKGEESRNSLSGIKVPIKDLSEKVFIMITWLEQTRLAVQTVDIRKGKEFAENFRRKYYG